MTIPRGLLIRGGTVVTHETMLKADVLVSGDKIQAVGQSLSAPADAEVLDANQMLILPGIIDAHTHIQLDTGIYRTPDDWFTETRAAAFGGVTTIVDFATQFKGMSFEEALHNRLEESSSSVIDYAFHMMVTDVPPDEEDRLGVLPELGIQSIKLYTTYRPNYYADDATLLRLLEAAARYGLITLVHCENDAIVTAQTAALKQAGDTGWRYHGMARPALAEQEATARVLFLANAVHAPVVIAHNSTGWTSAMVAQARERGQVAFSETTPQYLLLDDSLYEGSEPWRYILQPPLRNAAERARLWELVEAGQIDMLITDHCDYTAAQKMAVDDFTQTPGGLPGLETLLPLMATYGVADGRIEWPDLVRMLALAPAQIYNLWPRKGAIMPGSDADLVIFDPSVESTITADALHTIAGYTPYEGMRIQGRVVSTIRRGACVVRDGKFLAAPGSGSYLAREPYYWD